MNAPSIFLEARRAFHAAILDSFLTMDSGGIPSNADRHSTASVEIAKRIAEQLGQFTQASRLAGQMSGNKFEKVCLQFLRHTFLELHHLRPGNWMVTHVSGRNRLTIAEFEQYRHLVALDEAAKNNPELAAALGSDYTITPDIIIARKPEPDEEINRNAGLVDDDCCKHASLRERNNAQPILHASISCKWTVRSDRVQNARAEALNLVRNRKGRLPHIAVITGEPLPSRIAAIALGTGDIDCVYHFALRELVAAVKEIDHGVAGDLLETMISGKRLRDIEDLPLNLAV